MGRDRNEAFADARAYEAGRIYAQKHYHYVLFLLRLKWLPWVALGLFLTYCYFTGRNT